MGLDMYLNVNKYVSSMDRKSHTVSSEFKTLVDMSGLDGITKYSEFGGVEISYPVAYWRKANAIHGWIVNTLAGGVDECQEIHVPRNALVDLLAACKVVMSVSVGESKQDLADEVGLMPTEGFFFGGYQLDEYYDEQLKYTIDMLEHVLGLIPEDSFYYDFTYQASW
jgi:hypothetical protein